MSKKKPYGKFDPNVTCLTFIKCQRQFSFYLSGSYNFIVAGRFINIKESLWDSPSYLFTINKNLWLYAKWTTLTYMKILPVSEFNFGIELCISENFGPEAQPTTKIAIKAIVKNFPNGLITPPMIFNYQLLQYNIRHLKGQNDQHVVDVL